VCVVGGKKKKKKKKVCFALWQRARKQETSFCSPLSLFFFFKNKLPSTFRSVLCGFNFQRFPPLHPKHAFFFLLILLLLLFEQFVDLPLGHAGVLGDDAVLVQAGQKQQEAHDQVGEEQVVHLLSDPGDGQQAADH